MCRNQSEVTTVLNICDDDNEDELDEQTFEEGIPTLSRLRLAVNYNQKLVTTLPTPYHLYCTQSKLSSNK